MNKKNSQEIELHGVFKDRCSKQPAGQSGCGPEGEDRLQAENGGNGFPCTSILERVELPSPTPVCPLMAMSGNKRRNRAPSA